ncbi:hypothetical protein EYF80_042832 [Liparis tanakae]|uniref:Uncharacterized protein n=1 Tax=Liparis tanakae TaxID=230148 RepID=A0A4Z2G259_9TELE|nr:hypothetical protein EYF80_042832 [Liparis tanakae]
MHGTPKSERALCQYGKPIISLSDFLFKEVYPDGFNETNSDNGRFFKWQPDMIPEELRTLTIDLRGVRNTPPTLKVLGTFFGFDPTSAKTARKKEKKKVALR